MEVYVLIKIILIGLPVIFYFSYTIWYSFLLRKKTFLTRRQRIINFILIWLIPFIWIMFLKTFFQPVPGSHQIKNKNNPANFTENGLGIFDDTFSDH